MTENYVMPKVITTNIDKGGTGKSTTTYNNAKYTSGVLKKKTLLIDGDRSKNMSFSFPDLGDSTIADIFVGREVEIYEVGENLDFIQGSQHLSDDELNLKAKQNNCMILFMWFIKNRELLSRYDYIFIDTHNDMSLVTANFIAVSDVVIGVCDPSTNSFLAWLKLKDWIKQLKREVVDPITGESYITAEPYLIANKIFPKTKNSRSLLKTAKEDPRYIGMIEHRKVLEDSLLINTSIFEMYDSFTNSTKKNLQDFFDNTIKVFNNILEKTK
ncbi:ParA family protein [Enterococcus sp. AZ196]|uniref:ParA family protein n=1 Tax=Enterococcus sp. AZ196 TaxID=2774659 RepID=UPI003D26F0CF